MPRNGMSYTSIIIIISWQTRAVEPNLVGDWTNPFETMCSSKWESFPKIGVKIPKKKLSCHQHPPTSLNQLTFQQAGTGEIWLPEMIHHHQTLFLKSSTSSASRSTVSFSHWPWRTWQVPLWKTVRWRPMSYYYFTQNEAFQCVKG